MKKLILATLVTFLLVYVPMALIESSLDPGNWKPENRLIYIGISLLILFVLTLKFFKNERVDL